MDTWEITYTVVPPEGDEPEGEWVPTERKTIRLDFPPSEDVPVPGTASVVTGPSIGQAKRALREALGDVGGEIAILKMDRPAQ